MLLLERITELPPHSTTPSSLSSNYIAIGLLASLPRAPFWTEVFRVLQTRSPTRWTYVISHVRVIHQTGPSVVIEAYRRNNRGVGLLRRSFFFPCDVHDSEVQFQSCRAQHAQAIAVVGREHSWNNWVSHVLNSIVFLLRRTVVFWSALWIGAPWLLLGSAVLGGGLQVLSMVYCGVMYLCKWSPWHLLPLFLVLFRRKRFFVLLLLLGVVTFLQAEQIRTNNQALATAAAMENGPTVLFVLAHPDDEIMFFMPTLEALKARGYRVEVMFLTCGNADGLGQVRKKEADWVGKQLGFDVVVKENESFLDGMEAVWDLKAVADTIIDHVKQKKYRALITFDEYGVTNHPNHRSVYQSIRLHGEEIVATSGSDADICPLQLLKLVSPSVPFSSVFGAGMEWLFPDSESVSLYHWKIWNVWQAMSQYRSQWVWFRRLHVVFSSLSWTNRITQLVSLRYERYFSLEKTSRIALPVYVSPFQPFKL
jgi:N-acetylglucosaminylphosphatidylinositol deacetylase